LRDVTHALRVRVLAPFVVRVHWLAERLGSSTGRPMGTEPAHDAVADLVKHDDADRLGRMRYLYGQPLDNPGLYDLVINTEKDDVDGAVEATVALARRPSFETTPASTRRVVDFLLRRSFASP
jgi:cytidylate kinase